MNSAKIGIFDSGFGGLTVMRALCKRLPHESIVYFGDTARLPYGNKGKDTIVRYALEITSFLASQEIKLLVIACNTASALAFEQVQDASPVPVISIVDCGVEGIVHRQTQGHLAILGTRATIASGIYQEKLKALLPDITLSAIACPLLVPLVEEGYLHHPITHLTIQDYLHPLKEKQVQTLLLGCTHYPLLQHAIQSALGTDTFLLNPADTCARTVERILQEKALTTSSTTSPQHTFFVSDDSEKFSSLGPLFLGHSIDNVRTTHLYQSA